MAHFKIKSPEEEKGSKSIQEWHPVAILKEEYFLEKGKFQN
jgi:hypothetical protein